MLWYKSWLETRWRFLIGLGILFCSAMGIVFLWPKMASLVPLAANLDMSGELGRRIKESVEVSRQFRGYVWSQWFRQNLPQMGTLFAVLLGTGGLLAQSSGGAALYTLSMPLSRNRILGVRAATGLAELLVLSFVPTLFIPLLSPAVGESYSLADALVHALCMFITGSVFFSLAVLLSTVFADLWRPLLLALGAAALLALWDQVLRDPANFSIFRTMSAEIYFRSGQLPWIGLLACLAVSSAMLYAAMNNIARRDF